MPTSPPLPRTLMSGPFAFSISIIFFSPSSRASSKLIIFLAPTSCGNPAAATPQPPATSPAFLTASRSSAFRSTSPPSRVADRPCPQTRASDPVLWLIGRTTKLSTVIANASRLCRTSRGAKSSAEETRLDSRLLMPAHDDSFMLTRCGLYPQTCRCLCRQPICTDRIEKCIERL